MEKIIDPIDINLIKSELTPEKKLGETNKGGNELYIVDWFNAPNTVKEIGRLREVSYREAGASSGKSMDLDEYDTMENPYQQLIVWDPDNQAIIGGYRFILGSNVKLAEDGQPMITSSHLYKFSDEFIKEYLPHVMELGRSFVTPEYQSSRAGSKSIFTMDNLWDGITYVILEHPGIMYFMGKMTIYPSYNKTARNLIIHFLKKHFNDKDSLVRPKKTLRVNDNPELMDLVLCEDDLHKDLRLLKGAVRKLGTNIPPLVNSYMSATSSLKMLGSCVNDELGDAIETGIMVCFEEIYDDKRSRHIEAFINNKENALAKRYPDMMQSIKERLMENLKNKRARAFRRFKKHLGKKNPDIEFI
ncbi:MAG: GNAT family N-acetyltransferase [Bacteroidales bacterium]|nr:GNAT family N-acetyltransferase [Bacteroidales bacterium]